MKDATIAARAAGHIDRATGGVVPALHLSTTFARDDAYAPIASDHVYLRDDNDAARLAERIMAQLEQARAALLFPSGMAAIAAALRPVGNGGTLVLQRGIYWGTTQWVRAFCDRRGVRLVEVGTDEMTRAVEQERPEVIFVETPSNPWLETVDIAALAG